MSTGIKSLDLILVMLFAYSIVLLGMCLIYLSLCTLMWLGDVLYEHNKLAHIVVDFGDNILISIYEYISCILEVICHFWEVLEERFSELLSQKLCLVSLILGQRYVLSSQRKKNLMKILKRKTDECKLDKKGEK